MKSYILSAALALSIPFGTALAIDISFTGTVGGNASTSSGQTAGASSSIEGNATLNVRSEGESPRGLASKLTAKASAAVSSGGDHNLSLVLGLIERSEWSEDSLSDLVDIDATLFHVNPWISSDNRAAFEAALSANAGEIDDLQAAVYANFELDAWLAIRYAEASDVIAIGAAADGSLAVFVQ